MDSGFRRNDEIIGPLKALLEQFLPVDIIRSEISHKTLRLSESGKDPFRAKTSHCHRCSEHTAN